MLESLKGEKGYVAVAAPMVRYSKLPFRQLVKRYGTDLAYTPMILADSFIASAEARNQEFSMLEDHKDIVQFAAKDPAVFAQACQLVAPYVAGVDLNCGCPQRWALQEGIGGALLRDSELVYSMVRQASMDNPAIAVSVKIRLLEDAESTAELVARMGMAGARWVTVHGRTVHQRPSDPVDYRAIKAIKDAVRVPVIANGDIFTRDQADRIAMQTGVDGVMAARGLLANPALFSHTEHPPSSLARQYLQLAIAHGTTFHIIHHHIMQILIPNGLPVHLHRPYNSLSSVAGIIDFIDENA